MYEFPHLDAMTSFAHRMVFGEVPNSKHAVKETTSNVVFSIKKTVSHDNSAVIFSRK